MKFYSLVCILLLSLQPAVWAETKLALAASEATPTLATKYGGSSASSAVAPAPASATSLFGTWRGTAHLQRGPTPVTLTIVNNGNGTASGTYAIGDQAGHQVYIVGNALSGNGNHIKVTIAPNPRIKKPVQIVLMLDWDANTGTLQGEHIVGARGNYRLALTRVGAAVAAGSVNASGSLEGLLHAVDVQLFDQFNSEQFFTVVGSEDFDKVAPAVTNRTAIDFKNPTTLAKISEAGINYVLLTTLEDFQDQVVEMKRTQGTRYQAQTYNQVNRPRAVAVAATQTQTAIDPEVWQRQIITLNVRCQLFEAATGALKKSASASFPVQRDYVTVAQGRNELSSSDLLTAAAEKVSDWAAMLVDDAIFPIEVLAKKDNFITISRGTEAGLKEGQIFTIHIEGDEIKDPRTGAVLGRDRKTVGRATITELQPKFSKARILEDTGIINGATLVRKLTK